MAMLLHEVYDPILKQELVRSSHFPRLRYMGSKFKVIPYLTSILARLNFETALDAFCGSCVVGYAMKEMGKQVTANDFLHFPATVARAVIENPGVALTADDINHLLSESADGRHFIQDTFHGLYFSDEDHAFLDSIWSHIESMPVYKRELAIASLCLAVSRKQPRGVFTITDLRYDDGRKNLHRSLRELFLIAVHDYHRVIFDNGKQNNAICQDVFTIDPAGYDLVYFDPPYVPLHDDNDYIKRYHFLEGLSVYWAGQRIMEHTATKKIEKKFTPFAYKRTIRQALRELISLFRNSIIILSYSSNAYPEEQELYDILHEEKNDIEVFAVPHSYSFGTHATALRRQVNEYIFVAR